MALDITVTDKATHAANTVAGQEVSLSALSVVELPLSHTQVSALTRQGNDLVITVADGQAIVVHGFFVADPTSGHNDLVFKDDGGLWLSDLSGFDALPVDASVDTAEGGVFSSIDSIDPLFANASSADADTAAAAADDATSAGGSIFDGGLSWLPLAVAVGGFATALGANSNSNTTSTSNMATLGLIKQNPDGTLKVVGTATPNDTVTVTYADQSTNTGTVNSDGTYSVSSLGVQTTGSVSVVDTTTNSAPATQTWVDTTAPQAPVVGTVTANPDGTVTVTGKAEANSQITVIFADGSQAPGVAGPDGTYSVKSTGAETAGGVIHVMSTDAAGNDGASTSAALVTVGTPTANTDGTLTVSGTAAPGSIVTVTFADSTTAITAAGADGSYSINSSTPETGAVTVTANNPAPQPPIVTSVADNADGTVTVVGTALPNSAITVTFADGNAATGTADANGAYTVQSSTPETAGGMINVTAADALGNTSPPAAVMPVTVESAGPDAANSTLLTVTGTAEPGSTVIVFYADGNMAFGSAGTDGSYTVTSSGAESTVTSVTATEIQIGGAIFTATGQTPAISTITGNSDGTATVWGTAEPGSQVTVTFADGNTAIATVGGDGNFTATTSTVETSGTVTVATVDAANTTSSSASATYTDTTPPLPPHISSVLPNPEGGLTVTGTAEAGSTVTVTFQGDSTDTATGVAGSDGSFSINSAGTSEPGSGSVSVIATDAANNASTASTMTYQQEGNSDTAPEPSTTPPPLPAVGSIVSNDDHTLTVSGTAAPSSTVTVTFADGATATAIADSSDGSYSASSKVEETSGTVTVTITDAAGNDSAATTATLPLTGATPLIGAVTENADGTIIVTGTAAAGSVVVVTLPDGHTTVATAGADGSYSVSTSTAQPSGSIDVTAIDQTGGTSSHAEISYQQPLQGTIAITSIDSHAVDGSTDFVTHDPGLIISGTLSQPLIQNSVITESVRIGLEDSHGQTTWYDATVNGTTWTYDTTANPLSDDTYTVHAEIMTVPAQTPDGATPDYVLTTIPVEQTVVVDTIAPTETASIAAIATPEPGANSTDFVTSDGHLTFSGAISGGPLADGSAPGVSAESVQVSQDGGQNWNDATASDTNWTYDNTAHTLQDGLWVVLTRVADAAGNANQTVTAQQVEVSTTGTLNLSLADVLSDAHTLAAAGSTQQVTVNEGNGIVSTVNLIDGIGTGAAQWQDTGTAVVNGVTYDVYHNASEGTSNIADLLIQHSITVIG